MSDVNKGQGVESERDPLDFSDELEVFAGDILGKLRLGEYSNVLEVKAAFLKWDSEEINKVNEDIKTNPLAKYMHGVRKVKLAFLLSKIVDKENLDSFVKTYLKECLTIANELVAKKKEGESKGKPVFSEEEKGTFNLLMDDLDLFANYIRNIEKERSRKGLEEDLKAMEAVERKERKIKVLATVKSLSEKTNKKVLKASKPEKQEAKVLAPEQFEKLLSTLEEVFNSHMYRHKDLIWLPVKQRLSMQQETNPKKIWSLNEMLRTGGMSDVVAFDKETGQYRFRDCCPESPRRNLAYDKAGEKKFKKQYPNDRCDGNVLDTAAAMGIEELDETEYREAQQLDELDRASWSYLKTPVEIRKKGLAVCVCRNVHGVYVYRCEITDSRGDGGFRGAIWI